MGSRPVAQVIVLAVVGVAAIVVGAPRARADEPLRPPARHTVCSVSEAMCATSDPELGTFVHPADGSDESDVLWKLPRWYRVLFVTDDGMHLVTGYDGMNLVPQERPSETVVVEFWKRGSLVKSYSLGDLGYSRGRLQRTVSHYHWGGYLGIGEDGLFRLEMLDGVKLVFNPATGELLRREQ